MTLKQRPYQIEAARQSMLAWGRGVRSILVVMATGTGKTVLFSSLARRTPGRVLVLEHREELVEQAQHTLQRVCGCRVDVEMAGQYASENALAPARVVVASVQTLSSEYRRLRFHPDAFEVVVVDEAHHAPAKSYRAVLDHFRGARVLGVTATPRRLDRQALGQVFDECVFDYGIEPAVNDGWLVPVRQQAIKVDGLDFSDVRKAVSGDLSEADLEKILLAEKILHAMAVPTLEIVGDRPTLVFCASVAHAQGMAEVLNRYRAGCAVALSGATDKTERRRVVADYKAGRVQILCNCSLFLEGFDAPATARVVMGRPTSSVALYCQILGRATRPLPGVVDGLPAPADYLGLLDACDADPDDGLAACALADWCQDHGDLLARARRDAIAGSAKPDCLALDFVGNSGKHKLVTAADVLGGRYGQAVRDYARRTQEEEGEARGVDECLERAQAELALIEEEAERRKAIVAREVAYRSTSVDPFGRGPRVAAGQARGEPATDRQVNYLVYRANWKRRDAQALTKRQASAIIGRHREAARP